MIQKIIAAIALLCATTPSHAQVNQVFNGGFEQYNSCPTGLDQVANATYWTSIDTTTTPGGLSNCWPDYINMCSIWGAVTAPNNMRFYQYPHTGKGMIQIGPYYNYGTPSVYFYDYLQGRLISSLTIGQSYCVTFHVNMANLSAYAINNFGAYFDDGSIDTASQCGMPQTQYTPQILETAIISDTLNWIKVQGSFVANGTETYITIGNFFDTAHTAHVQLNGGSQAIYLVDDVSVIASNAVADAGPDVSLTIGDITAIGVAINGDGMPCYWYVAGNTVPVDSGGTIKVHPTTNTTYVVSMDLCGTITYDTMQVNVHPDGITTITTLAAATVSPNPGKEQITIGGLRTPTQYRLLTMQGCLVHEGQCTPTENVIPLAELAQGVYLIELWTPDGTRVVKKVIKE